jgi:hypothetical protein
VVIPVTEATTNLGIKKPVHPKKDRFCGRRFYFLCFSVTRAIVATWRRRRRVVITTVVLVVVTAPVAVVVTLLLFPTTALFFFPALLSGTDGGSGDSAESGANEGAFASITVTGNKRSDAGSSSDAGGGTTLGGSASHREKGSADGENPNELIFHVT